MINRRLDKKVINAGILPNLQQKLLLKACLMDGKEAIDYFNQWYASYSFPQYANIDSNVGLPAMYDQLDGGSQRLLSLLYKNQFRLGNDHPVIKMLQGYYKHIWYRNQILKNKYQQISKTLKEQHIESIVFKGIGISEKYYGDLGSRPTVDIDLLVKRDDWNQSIAILNSIGWDSKFGNPVKLPNSLLYAHTFQNGALELDLHFHISHYDFNDQTKKQIWEYCETDIAGYKTLPKSVELLVTFLHGLQYNLIPPIRWVADSVMILKKFTEADWKLFMSIVEKEKNAAIVSIAINFLKDNGYFNIPVEIQQRLQQLETSKINFKYFTIVGLRKNPNDFKTAIFSLYKIIKLNKWNPRKILFAIFQHCKYLWAVESNRGVLKILFKRIKDKVLNPKIPYNRNSN